MDYVSLEILRNICLLSKKENSKDTYIEKCINYILEIMKFDGGAYVNIEEDSSLEIKYKVNFEEFINKDEIKLEVKIQIIHSSKQVKIIIPILENGKIIGIICFLKRDYDEFYVNEENQRKYEMIGIGVSSQIEYLRKEEIENE